MEEIKPSRFRIAAAARFEESQKIPWVTLFEDAFMLKFTDFRKSDYNANFTKYRFASCMLDVITKTFFGLPEMNVMWKRAEDKEDPKIIRRNKLRLGMALETVIKNEPCSAVATVNAKAKNGFIDAYRMNLHQFNARVAELSQKAAAGKLGPEDYDPVPNVVFNNLGAFKNIKRAVPLPPPSCSIMVSVFRSKVRNIYLGIEYGNVLRETMEFAVSFDHRLFDGPKMDKFMGVLKEKIENPRFD